MKAKHSFIFPVQSWLTDLTVRLLSPELKGALLELLFYSSTQPDGGLPDDDNTLSQLSGLGIQWQRHKDTLMLFFSKRGGRLFNDKWVTPQIAKKSEISMKRSEAAKLGNLARWGNKEQPETTETETGKPKKEYRKSIAIATLINNNATTKEEDLGLSRSAKSNRSSAPTPRRAKYKKAADTKPAGKAGRPSGHNHEFTSSEFYNYIHFDAVLKCDPEFPGVDTQHYHSQLKDWAKQGHVRQDWMAMARTFVRNDIADVKKKGYKRVTNANTTLQHGQTQRETFKRIRN